MVPVRGEIPRELNGTLYRNSPSQNILPEKGFTALHTFDGDGLIQAYRFEDGSASYASAFVRHPTFLAEEKEGRYCMPGVGLPADGPPIDLPPPGRIQPNTNVVYHAGRLLALVENGVPFELDPRSLESIGPFDLEGKMKSLATSAHPKIDARTGQMLLHGYAPFAPHLQLYVIEPDGHVSLAEAFDAPHAPLVHDMAITEKHVILPIGPIRIDFPTLAAGGILADALHSEPELGLKFAVRSREPDASVRWFEAPISKFFIHFGNAYEVGNRIVFDAYLYDDAQQFLDKLCTLRNGGIDDGLAALPYEFELNLATGACNYRELGDLPAEFPRMDDRLTGYRNRWTYTVVSPDHSSGVYLNALAKRDGSTGAIQVHQFGVGRFAGEPVFAPRHACTEEDDGYILAPVYHGLDDAMDLVILDARDFSAEPLAELRLDHRVPLGFHGNFAPDLVDWC